MIKRLKKWWRIIGLEQRLAWRLPCHYRGSSVGLWSNIWRATKNWPVGNRRSERARPGCGS